MTYRTLTELYRAVVAYDKPDCLLHKVGDAYQPVSTHELAQRVRALAGTLDGWGVGPGDRVALMADNGPHWPTIDFAVLALGAADVPIYSTLLSEGAAYIVRDSGAKVLFVQGEKRLAGLVALRAEMPSVEWLVAIGCEPGDPDIVRFDDAIAAGAETAQVDFDGWLARAQPDDLATLIYTSGTTGDPKGVMLTHANLASNVSVCRDILPIRRNWTALSFLPLAHSFERTLDYVFFAAGATIAYAESVQTVVQNLGEVRPHVFGSVPRLYEKVRAGFLEKLESATGFKKSLMRWALESGRRALPKRLKFRNPGIAARLADWLVFSKLKAALGGRFQYAVSGGAPLGKEVGEFFWSAGIPLLEGYGLTETSPVVAVNTPKAVRLGTVGRPIPGVEVKIAPDGEILARGPNIMAGYYGKPEESDAVLDAEGWFSTGDIGELDADGFLKITDRKKELIVNAYGKNIAPAPLENDLKSGRFVSQAMVVGDRRPFLSALLVPNFDALAAWGAASGRQGKPAEWLAEPGVRALFQGEVDRVNARHERYEQIRAFDLLPRELTLEAGELTPTMKLKRKAIHANYRERLDALYAAAEREA
jgi:long-chain acyl-CoA synthetase